ncbi:hypothetical protein LCGC14_2905490, partial [marine sediment metagenome]
ELDQAEILLDQMLNNLENERNIVYGLYYSCICLVKRGEYSKAEEYLKNCIDIFETNKWEQKDPINDLKICFQIKKMEKEIFSKDGEGCAVVPKRYRFLDFFVNVDFVGSTHGSLGCTTCHGRDTQTS